MVEETKKAEELLTKVNAKESPLEQEKISKESQKHIEQLKTKLEAFKKAALKKFPYIDAIGLIPPPSPLRRPKPDMNQPSDDMAPAIDAVMVEVRMSRFFTCVSSCARTPPSASPTSTPVASTSPSSS